MMLPFTYNLAFLQVNLIAPPQYVLTVTTLDHTDGFAAVNKAIGEIEESIVESGGSFKMVMEPKIVNRTDDIELARELERLGQQNEEVAGDDDASGDETDSTIGGASNKAHANGDAARNEDDDEEEEDS